MKRGLFSTVAAATSIAVLGGACTSIPEIDREKPARIYDMEHDDRDFTGIINICTGFDKNGQCTSSIPIRTFDEEHYRVSLAQCPDLTLPSETDAVCVTEYVDVSEHNFGQLNEGDAVRFYGDVLVRILR